MRTLILMLALSVSIPHGAHARLLHDSPEKAALAPRSEEQAKQVRVERGMNMGLVQELIITCPSSEVGIISYSKVERVFCTSGGCSTNMATSLRDFCGLGTIGDAFAGR